MKFHQNTRNGTRVAGKDMSGYASGMLCGPSGVLFNKRSNSLFICDYHNRRVLEWDYNRCKYKRVITNNIACGGLAIDKEGAIYVSDTERHEVRRYLPGDRHGVVVAGGNGQGPRLKQLNHPTYIFVTHDQSVYVSDTWNDRVVKWEKNAKEGVIVAGGNGKGKDTNQFNCPTGLLIDRLGAVYVADYWNNRVVRWYEGESKGRVIAGELQGGNKPTQLSCPEGIAFDRNGDLYVADSNNHRIQRFFIKTD